MRIAYVVPQIEENGGIQEFAKSILNNINNQIIIDLYDYKYDLFHVMNVFLCKLPDKIGAFLFKYIFKYYFRKKYNLKNYELIHFWHIDAACAFTDKNYIVTCHGLEILPKNISKYKKILYAEALSHAKIITADSTYTKNLILQNFKVSSNKIIVINPGVSTKVFNKAKIIDKKFVIGSLSRFVERKNFMNIIKALEILKLNTELDFIYYIAGNGLDKSKILKRLNEVSFKWKYFGEISNSDKINKFYPSLDLFVLPPLALENSIEGFGIVYIEANSAGVPVVASQVGGIVDAVKDGYSGVFANPKEPEDIADKIYSSIKLIPYYKKNIPKWIQKHDISNTVKKFEKLYYLSKLQT